MARNKKVEILSNEQEVLHPMTDGDCVIFEDGQTLTQKLSEDDSVKYTPEIVNSSPMFKVGEGNTVDYSDNVLDGAYERATLQGQTYVNYIQESSADEVTLPTHFDEYGRTQHKTLTSDEEGTLGINLVGQSYVNALQHDSEEEFVVLGESLEFQEKKVEYTNEGQIKSAMLKGQTLVNIFKSFTNYTYIASEKGVKWLITGSAPLTETLNNDELTMTLTGAGSKVVRIDDVSMLKPNTKYMVKLNYTTSFEDEINFGCFNNSTIYTQIASMKSNEYAIFTTPSDLSTWVGLWFGVLFDLQIGDVMKISKPVLIEYQEGMENWDIPYFEGMQSVTVSTKLENKTQPFTNTCKQGKTFTTADSASRSLYVYDSTTATTNPINLKPKTKYLIQFTINNLVLDGLSRVNLIWSDSTLASGNCLFGEKANVGISANGIYRTILTTTDLITTSSFVIKGYSGEWENSGSTLRSLTISEVMCIEYQNGMENWDLPYFEDYQVMKPVQVESVNKNLFDKNNFILNKGLAWTDGSVVTINNQGQQASESYVPINYDSTYVMSGLQNGLVVCVYDRNKNVIGFLNNDGRTIANLGDVAGTAITSFNLSNYPQSKYVRFCVGGDGSQNTQDISNIQIEESDTATEYVPHQSKTTYSWDEVILRKIGNVEDTLDLTTGEWVQRIGEITYDGSEYFDTSKNYFWYINQNLSNEDYTTFMIDGRDGKPGSSNFICDKLPNKPTWLIIETGVWTDSATILTLPTSIATTTLQLKEYLQTNQLRIQYELATPIVHKVNLSRPNLQVYDDITHVHTKCLDGTLIPNIYLPSDISYPAILEPSTTYNVCIDHTEVSADNPLTVNVGGTEITMTDSRMTLTTPTTLAHGNVLFTGKGNKIKESMLIKNSSLLTGDLPHFNGIGSVQLGRTVENLCSSHHAAVVGGGIGTLTESNDYYDIVITKAGSYVLLFKLSKILENDKKYFVYAPNTFPTNAPCYASFAGAIQGSWLYTNEVSPQGHQKYWILNVNQKTDSYSHLCLGQHGSTPINSNLRLQRPIICEYEPGMENWDWESIGYFTGTKNIGNEFMRVQNKNLFDGLLENGIIDADGKLSGSSTIGKRTINYISVKPNTSYTYNITGYNNTLYTHEYTSDFKVVRQLNGRTFITSPTTHYIKFNTHFNHETSENSTFQLEESSTATTYTAHKHNGLYITKDQPIELTWEQGRINPSGVGDSYTNAINNAVSYGVRNKGLLNLKPNTTYRVSLGDKTNFKYHIAVFDNSDNALSAASSLSLSGDWVSSKDTIFTTTKDAHKIGINVQKQDASSITPSEINHIRLEEVTDIVLRGIDDVCDELDITRGIYTQRIGEVVLNGSEAWTINTNFSSTYTVFYTIINDTYDRTMSGTSITDKFNNIKTASELGTVMGFYIGSGGTSNKVAPFISSDKTTTEELRQWLKTNPVKVQYKLATPIVHQVYIGNKNEANTEVIKPNDVFTLPTLYTEQTHIDMTNNGIIPRVQSRDYIAYPISPMVGRTYTLQHNLTGGVSNLTVDLLGRTQSVPYQNYKSLVYTPETMDTILHNELRISGKGKISRVMYIDGGYMDRDIPYIEGMKNAVNPIVKNIGKNFTSVEGGNTNFFIDKIIGNKTYYLYMERSSDVYYNLICYENSDRSGRATIIKSHQNKNLVSFISPFDGYLYFNAYSNIEVKNVTLSMKELSSYEPYKENICYIDCGEIRLTQDMFTQGSISNTQANIGKPYINDIISSPNRLRTKELIELEIGEQYVFLGDTDNYKYSAHFYDKDGNKVALSYDLSWKATTPFTVKNDAPMCAFFIARKNDTSITVDDKQAFNFHLVKVSEIKQLRSLPNGVHDEIDLETGEYVQRVGEIVFNGDTKFDDWGERGENGLTFNYYDPQVKQLENEKVSVFADTLLGTNLTTTWGGTPYTVAQADNGNYLQICLNKNDLRESTRDGINDYFLQNPVTVQYELATPIIRKVDIAGFPHSYEGGHVIIENGDPNTPIPAQLTYRAVANRSGQIQQHTEQVEKQEREINELEMLILGNIHLSQTRF